METTPELTDDAGANNGPDANVPPAALAGAREDVVRQAKALARSAAALEQMALIEDVPFEEAFCLSPDEVRKRYTAENARQIEWRRDAAIKLLARQCPAADICDILRMNHRTVAAIAAQEGQKIGAFSEQYYQTLAGSAMSDLALAETMKYNASFKDLHYAANVKMTHAAAFKMIGAGSAEETAIELETENENLAKARKFIETHWPQATTPEDAP